jgi:Cdc6-like AAA superfamily ATPase
MKVKEWLSSPDTSINLNEALERHHEGTGSWFLDSDPFQEWKSGTRRHIWLHGIPGCGKTVLSATIIKHLNQQLDAGQLVLYFFFDFTNSNKQSLDKLVRSLVAQLYGRCEASRNDLDKLSSLCERGDQQPTFKALCTTLLQMLNYMKRVYIVIDALDECNTRLDLLMWLEYLASSGSAGVQLLIASRKEEDIESQLNRWLCPESHIAIQKDAVNHDIRAYIHQRLRCDREFERWHSQPSVQDEIETQLMKKADGM